MSVRKLFLGGAIAAMLLTGAGARAQELQQQTPVAAESLTAEEQALAILGDESLAPEKRRTELQTIANGNPDSAPIWTAYGESLEGIGDDALALTCYERAVGLDPNLYTPWFRIGILSKRGTPEPDLERAETAFRRALTAGSARPQTLNELGVTMALRGDFAGAVEVWKQAIEEDPEWGALYANLLKAATRLEDRKLGEAYIQGAIDAERFDETAVFIWSNFLMYIDEPADAIALLDKAIATHGINARYLYYKGLAQVATKDTETARATFESALATARNDPDSHQIIQATEFEIFRIDNPKDEARFQSAQRLVFDQETSGSKLKKRLEQAVEMLDPLAKRHPDFWNIFFVRGLAHRRLDHREEARTDFERVLELHPDEPNATIQLALMERDDFNFSKAAELADRAVELAPRDPTITMNAGLIMIEAGKCERAWELYTLSVKMMGEANCVVLRDELEIRCADAMPTGSEK